MSINAYINNGKSLDATTVAYGNPSEGGFVFMSAVCTATTAKQAAKDVNKKNTVYISGHYFTSVPKGYDVHTAKIAGGDYTQIVICRKDEENKEENGSAYIAAYIFFDDETSWENMNIIDMATTHTLPQGLLNGMYDKIYKLTGIPVRPEWMEYLVRPFAASGFLNRLQVEQIDSNKHFQAYSLIVPVDTIIQTIQVGLRNGYIEICEGENYTSERMMEAMTIDPYLESFGDIHARHVQEVCQARFTPNKDDYCDTLKNVDDYISYNAGIHLFEAQKAVVQGVSNTLDHQKAAYIIAEMGSGN